MAIHPMKTGNLCKISAFTLIEIIVALAVVSIALVALLQLHLRSLQMAQRGDQATRALMIADNLISETLAAGRPKIGTTTGSINQHNHLYKWQKKITSEKPSSLPAADTGPLRRIEVQVWWGDNKYQQVKLLVLSSS